MGQLLLNKTGKAGEAELKTLTRSNHSLAAIIPQQNAASFTDK
jgi:hypothetical protein